MPSAKRPEPELWGKLKPLIREKRSEPTQAEDLLWAMLRKRQISGFKFRRQHAIGRFIVDFYCAQARLVIEVDGAVHRFIREEDAAREAFLASLALRILRFRNEEVAENPGSVCRVIESALITSPPATATPSPQCGEGD